ncbi:MAG: hypothetical protein JWM11_4464 [Planctomycetaceae bacterium]|nr:hypothetical protein [Planctomycetaceae bacterium]
MALVDGAAYINGPNAILRPQSSRIGSQISRDVTAVLANHVETGVGKTF